MGVAKYIHISCPGCGRNMLVQYEYDGPDWAASDLPASDLPPEVAKALDGEDAECGHCGREHVLRCRVRHSVEAVEASDG